MKGAAVALRVPDLSEVLTPGLGIDPVAFSEWLLLPLTRYRIDEQIRAQATTRKGELAALDALERNIRTACDLLGFGSLPPVAEALMNDISYRARGEQLHEISERVLPDLHRLLVLVEQARSTILDAGPQRAGRRPNTARDRLLREVLAELRESGLKAEVARSVAEQVLVRCGVPVPAHDTSIRRATQRAVERVQK